MPYSQNLRLPAPSAHFVLAGQVSAEDYSVVLLAVEELLAGLGPEVFKDPTQVKLSEIGALSAFFTGSHGFISRRHRR